MVAFLTILDATGGLACVIFSHSHYLNTLNENVGLPFGFCAPVVECVVNNCAEPSHSYACAMFAFFESAIAAAAADFVCTQNQIASPMTP
jgi:hypothetical protein